MDRGSRKNRKCSNGRRITNIPPAKPWPACTLARELGLTGYVSGAERGALNMTGSDGAGELNHVEEVVEVKLPTSYAVAVAADPGEQTLDFPVAELAT